MNLDNDGKTEERKDVRPERSRTGEKLDDEMRDLLEKAAEGYARRMREGEREGRHPHHPGGLHIRDNEEGERILPPGCAGG